MPEVEPFDTRYLERATMLIASMQLELEGKGYPARLVAIAIERARGTAETKSAPIGKGIRGQAFYDLLRAEMLTVESWLIGQQRFLEGQDK